MAAAPIRARQGAEARLHGPLPPLAAPDLPGAPLFVPRLAAARRMRTGTAAPRPANAATRTPANAATRTPANGTGAE